MRFVKRRHAAEHQWDFLIKDGNVASCTVDFRAKGREWCANYFIAIFDDKAMQKSYSPPELFNPCLKVAHIKFV